MPFNIVVGGVVRHVMYSKIAGQVSVTKRDYQCVSITGGSQIDGQSVVEMFDNYHATGMKNCMSFMATYYGSQLYYQTPVGLKPRPVSTTLNQGIGSDAGELLPTQSCGLISLYTDTLGKTGQGRVYVPFPAQDSIDSTGSPDALYLTDLTTLATSLIAPHVVPAGAVTGTFTPVLYIPGGEPPKPIIRFVVRDAFATQRRRGAFGRLNANPF
jgi:hypothetical protein